MNMHLWEGKVYKDDRLFILDLTPAKKKGEAVWAVVTRRNVDGFPAFRLDTFQTKDEAVKFIEKVEPTTPRIGLQGKAPEKPFSYDDYCQQLKTLNVPSAVELYEMNKNVRREIILDDIGTDVE